MRSTALAIALVACGRIDFTPVVGVGTGADQCVPVTPVPDPVVITGTTSRVTNFTGSDMIIPDTSIAVTTQDGATLATGTSDGSGAYRIAVPTGGVAPSVTVTFTSAGQFTAIMVPARPLDRDPHLVPNLFDGGSLQSVYNAGSAGTVGSDAIGTLIVYVEDCDGVVGYAGVSATISPAPQYLEYSGSDGFDTSLTATEAPYANIVGFDQPPGIATLSFTGDVPLAAPSQVVVKGGDFVTFAIVQPASD
ncbi:MAG TPA: hypothetical protein VGG74_04820 [Kofleriaceae bacterium]|jgi:hypothetical protein